MSENSKDDLLKTAIAIALMALGAWGVRAGGKLQAIGGSICFIIGFIIMVGLYGQKWLWWGGDWFE